MNNGFEKVESSEKSNTKELKETRSVWAELYGWIDYAVITVLCLLFVFIFLFRQVKIEGGSMEKTLLDGERIVVSNVFYTPKYGDIVVISSEVYDNVPIIKRVIATEGQWVDIKDGHVYVGKDLGNMKKIGTEFVGDIKTDANVGDISIYGANEYPMLVPENKVFVLGDNRPVSVDSRCELIGMVDERQILGKALFRIYPFDKFGSIYE